MNTDQLLAEIEAFRQIRSEKEDLNESWKGHNEQLKEMGVVPAAFTLAMRLDRMAEKKRMAFLDTLETMGAVLNWGAQGVLFPKGAADVTVTKARGRKADAAVN